MARKRTRGRGEPREGPYVGLEVHEDMRLVRRSWVVQRIGWGVMAALLLAALLGLFGTGPLSRATATAPGGAVTLDYDRFGRYLGPATLLIRVGPGAAPGGVRSIGSREADPEGPADPGAVRGAGTGGDCGRQPHRGPGAGPPRAGPGPARAPSGGCPPGGPGAVPGATRLAGRGLGP